MLILICKYFYTWYTNVYDLLHNDSTIGTNCDKNSFLLLLRRKGIRIILKFERVKLLPEKTQWPAYFHHSPDRKMTRSIIDEDFQNKKIPPFPSLALSVEFSDESVSYSRKTYAQKQFLAFNRITVHFHSMLWISVYIRFPQFQCFCAKSPWYWQLFHSKSRFMWKMPFTNFTFQANGWKWNHVKAQFTEILAKTHHYLVTNMLQMSYK